jgi:zinc D-Ala-D-Ala carboxypeptidase
MNFRFWLAACAALLLSVVAGDAASLPSVRAPSSKYGHRAYAVAAESDLISVGKYRQTGRVVKMRRAAGEAFLRMKKAAAAEGLDLVPISGFRTLDYQRALFERARKKHGSERNGARWVAPPGFSEHHTGWTLDFGDGGQPGTDVEQSFEKTKVFRWLQANAGRFGFELSFPKNNSQGVGYEPWHWRFVGAEEARKTFHPQ